MIYVWVLCMYVCVLVCLFVCVGIVPFAIFFCVEHGLFTSPYL